MINRPGDGGERIAINRTASNLSLHIYYALSYKNQKQKQKLEIEKLN